LQAKPPCRRQSGIIDIMKKRHLVSLCAGFNKRKRENAQGRQKNAHKTQGNIWGRKKTIKTTTKEIKKIYKRSNKKKQGYNITLPKHKNLNRTPAAMMLMMMLFLSCLVLPLHSLHTSPRNKDNQKKTTIEK
jgi:hypothetical protein